MTRIAWLLAGLVVLVGCSAQPRLPPSFTGVDTHVHRDAGGREAPARTETPHRPDVPAWRHHRECRSGELDGLRVRVRDLTRPWGQRVYMLPDGSLCRPAGAGA